MGDDADAGDAGMTIKTDWDLPGLQQRLAELCDEELSMHVIAKRLNEEFNTNLTKNSIVGRAYRTGLSHGYGTRPRPMKQIDEPLSPLQPLQPIEHSTLQMNNYKGRIRRALEKHQKKLEDPTIKVVPPPKPPEGEPDGWPQVADAPPCSTTLVKLKHYQCRYPYGYHPHIVYCGRRSHNGVYCEEHRARCYTKGRE